MGRSSKKFRAIIDVVSLLSRSSTIQQLVGDKIYPLVNTDDTTGDFIAYQRAGYQRQDTKMGFAVQRSDFFMTVVSSDYNRSLEIAEAVFDVLEGDHAEYDMRIRMIDYEEDYLDKKFCQILKFSLE